MIEIHIECSRALTQDGDAISSVARIIGRALSGENIEVHRIVVEQSDA